MKLNIVRLMKSELKVLFYLKKQQKRKEGVCPVMGRIRVGKSMAQFSLRIEAKDENWDIKAGRMTGKSTLALEVNREINRINLLLFTRYKELQQVSCEISAEELKGAMQGIASGQHTLMKHFAEMNTAISKRVNLDIATATELNYVSSCKWLKAFLREKHQTEDIPFRALNYSFIENFYNYLLIEAKLSIGTSRMYLIYLRKVVRHAVHEGILFHDPFQGFEAEAAEVVHKTLTRDELDRFMSSTPRLFNQQVTKDVFIFSTFTGISYVDMKKLRFSQITLEADGGYWIIDKRHKTKVEYQVRLLDIPLAIIEKYRAIATGDTIFPMPENQIIHYNLNALAKQCGISKKLSVHIARHTFGSLITLSEGVPIETVSKMLGHEHIKTTQIYAELSLDKIAQDVRKLSVKLKGQFTLTESLKPPRHA